MTGFRYIVHKDLSDPWLKAICMVKSLAFPHNVESQKRWIQANIFPEDIHLIYKPARSILAYLDIVRIDMEIDGRHVEGYGIGSVCSREKGKGYGMIIMNEVGTFLDREAKPGMLFCKNQLVPFYQKAGWQVADKEAVKLSVPDQAFETMTYNCPEFSHLKYTGRLF